MAIALSGGSTVYTSTFTASPAANRAVTVPDSDFTITGNDLTQTLTNKTLTSPTANDPKLNLTVDFRNGGNRHD